MAKPKKTTRKTTTTAKTTTTKATNVETKNTDKAPFIVPTIPRQLPLKSLASITNTEKEETVTCQEEVYVQFVGKEISHTEILNKIHKDYENNGAPEKIITMNAYIKPDEEKIYYVVNDTYTGSVDY